jgi:site-specific DNA-methyltransferase (adenine-specific)
MNIIEVDIDLLRPYERNPRYNDQAVDAVAKSIELYGWHSPIIVDADYVIIAGHTRLKAAEQLGLAKVPCIVADHLSEDLVKAYRIADNKLAEIATWNYDALQIELASLEEAGVDMSLLDFEIVDLSAPIEEDIAEEGETDADALPEEEEEIRSTINQTYALGEHRLFCSDSVNVGTIPPVTMVYANFQKKSEEHLSACLEVFSGLVNEACFYVFVSAEQEKEIYRFFVEHGMDVAILYLIKKSSLSGKRDYQHQAESCIYASVGKKKTKELPSNLFYNEAKAKRSASKPTETLVEFLKASTKKGDYVLSICDDEGSMLLACEQMTRKCLAIVSTPEKSDIVRKRFAEFREGEGCDWEKLTPAIEVKQ